MFRPSALAKAALLTVLAAPVPAGADATYWTTPTLLKDFFRASKRVGYVKLITTQHAAALQARLGYVPRQAEHVIFVARTGDHIDGYAIVHDEQGQHEPITFGIKLGPDGRVERTEVMVYREGHGEEIREARFRKQFVGRGPGEPLRFEHEIDAISGATISSKSATLAVERALAVLAVARAEGPLKVAPTAQTARTP